MITLYRGDDTGGQLGKNVKIAFHCDDAVDMNGVTVRFNLLNVITNEWTNIHDGDILEMFVTHEQSGRLPLGLLFGKIWGEDSSGKIRTFANRLPIIVTHDLRKVYGSDGLDSQDIHVYSSVDWDAIANKPTLFPSKIELVDGLPEALDGVVKSVNGKTADAAGAVTLTLDSFANKDGEIQVKQTLMVSRDGGKTFNAVAAIVDVWNEIDNHNSSATAHANLMAAIANTFAKKSDIPSVVAPSASATEGQAADAKAVGEALAGKVDNVDGVIKNSLIVSKEGDKTVIVGGAINHAFDDGIGVNLVVLALPKKDGMFALVSDIADATNLTPVLDADGHVTGYKLGDKASPVLLTDDAKAALFAGAVISSTSTELTNMACSVVPFADGMTITFAASTGLRQCEVLITGCTAGASLNVTATKLRGDADALTLEDGDNHLTFAEYATGEFFVTRHLANEIA